MAAGRCIFGYIGKIAVFQTGKFAAAGNSSRHKRTVSRSQLPFCIHKAHFNLAERSAADRMRLYAACSRDRAQLVKAGSAFVDGQQAPR